MKGDTMKKDYITTQAADFAIIWLQQGDLWQGYRSAINYMIAGGRYDHTSRKRGRTPCLRYKPTAAMQAWYREEHKPILSITQTELDELKTPHDNNGTALERYTLQAMGWAKAPCRSWWEGGDAVTADGNLVQIKAYGGTICTAKQCREHR